MNLGSGIAGAALLVTAAGCPSRSGGGAAPGAAEDALVAKIEAICQKEKNGGPAWDARIKDAFVAYADANESYDIDSEAELLRIPCGIWRTMDEGVRRDEESPFMLVYGFHPQLIWVGHAVGIARSLREVATARLEACGLTSDAR